MGGKRMNEDTLEVVSKLNDCFSDTYFLPFEYHATGYAKAILFMGIRIWTDADDCRKFFEATNTYELLYDYCLRESRAILEVLNSKLGKGE
jgi:hypothetical protein